MTSYSISDPDKPWIILFSSPQLETIAEALVAQPQVPASTVYATLDGKPRGLSNAERVELFKRVLELNPDDPAAAAQLTAAQQGDQP